MHHHNLVTAEDHQRSNANLHSCSSNQEVDSMQDDDNKDDFKTLGH